MKTYNHLFERITSFENLLLAANRAQKGKRTRGNTADFNFFREKEIFKLQEELCAQTYQPGKYRQFYVYEPKPRLISAAPYRDRVVHQAFCGVVEPIFEARFIYDSYACRVDKGTHKAMLRCQEFLRKNRYVLKCDIERYFPSINHKRLLTILAKKIKDTKTLQLARIIINSANGLRTIAEERKEKRIEGTGLPIGNLTSQFFANLYLNELDYFVKFDLKEKHYLRYMDDFLVFGDDKKHLQQVKKNITRFLGDSSPSAQNDEGGTLAQQNLSRHSEELILFCHSEEPALSNAEGKNLGWNTLKLKLHPKKSTVFPVKLGVDFCGFRIFDYYRKIRRSNVKLFKTRTEKMRKAFSRREITLKEVSGSVRAWIAHANWGNTYNLRKRLMWRMVFKRGTRFFAFGSE